MTVGNSLKAADSVGCDGVTNEMGGYSKKTLFEGDPEEREAIQSIDGEAALCVHCGEFVSLNEEPVPVAGGSVLHQRCHDGYFGFEPQDQP